MAKRALPVLPEGFADPKLPTGTFSHSQYNRYKTCPKSYEFRYVEQRVLPPAIAMFRGTTVHAGAEAAHKHMIEASTVPPLEAMKAVVADAFEATKGEVVDWEGETQGAVKDLSISLYAKYHNENLPKLRPISAEEGFARKVGTVPMTGFIDLVDRYSGFGVLSDQDPPVIVDLKTSSSKWTAADVEKDTQLTLYSIVYSTPFVRIDNLVPLKAGPAFHRLEARRDLQAKKILIEDLEETTDLIKAGVFPKTQIDSWACSQKWCGYWSLCRGKAR